MVHKRSQQVKHRYTGERQKTGSDPKVNRTRGKAWEIPADITRPGRLSWYNDRPELCLSPAGVYNAQHQELPVVCSKTADIEASFDESMPAEPAPDDGFLTGEPSNTVGVQVSWPAQPYMTSGKYANH